VLHNMIIIIGPGGIHHFICTLIKKTPRKTPPNYIILRVTTKMREFLSLK